MSSDATASTPRLPLTVGDLTELVGDHVDPKYVTIGVQFTVDGEPVTTWPVDAYLTIHHSGLVELTIETDIAL